MTTTTCPDPTAHEENVAELMFGRPDVVVPADRYEAWQAAVDVETAACEGTH